MWNKLPARQREEYKKHILAFSSFTPMFSQKTSSGEIPAPYINSKFQETAFQNSFNATVEDVGNTSFDASLTVNNENSTDRFIVGIKTFGIKSGNQKIAQFKHDRDKWAHIIEKIELNSKNPDGSYKEKDEINHLNKDLYKQIALRISKIRNMRIESSIENLKGFGDDVENSEICAVYHVLMPSEKNSEPEIFVGETSYNKIDEDSIEIEGCATKTNPKNFFFRDKHHRYEYTNADSQLLMDFQNKNIIIESWPIIYAPNPAETFIEIAETIFSENLESNENLDENITISGQQKLENENPEDSTPLPQPNIVESYTWSLINKHGEVEKFSGFNSFYGVGSKLGKNTRKNRIETICTDYENTINNGSLNRILENLRIFLMEPAKSKSDRDRKIRIRKQTIDLLNKIGNVNLKTDVMKLLYRPLTEMYIPIPDARNFHNNHPDFFAKDAGTIITGTHKLKLPKEEREFDLIFEPSGKRLRSFITQDDGKAIESVKKQSYLGKWLMEGVFQLEEGEPLTTDRLMELEINAIKLYKLKGSNDVHLEFVWI